MKLQTIFQNTVMPYITTFIVIESVNWQWNRAKFEEIFLKLTLPKFFYLIKSKILKQCNQVYDDYNNKVKTITTSKSLTILIIFISYFNFFC